MPSKIRTHATAMPIARVMKIVLRLAFNDSGRIKRSTSLIDHFEGGGIFSLHFAPIVDAVVANFGGARFYRRPGRTSKWNLRSEPRDNLKIVLLGLLHDASVERLS